MKKNLILGIFCLISLGSLAVLGSSPQFVEHLFGSLQNNPITGLFSSEVGKAAKEIAVKSKDDPKQETKDTPEQKVPEHILWRVIFSFPERLEKAAKTARSEGQDDSLWTNYFVRQAGLSSDGSLVLTEKSSAFSKEFESINERAGQIIQGYRTNREKLPSEAQNLTLQRELQKELIGLETAKIETTIRHRDNLKEALGDEEFLKFEQWVLVEFAKRFTVTDDKSPVLEEIPGDLPENNGFTPFNEVPKRQITLEGGQN